MKQWFIGCSGFTYKHWKETFYPRGVPQKKWFEYYCEHFNTVELNVTFYRMPAQETFEGWYERSPRNFRFTVKAPRLVTHYRKFINAAKDLDNFYTRISNGLRDKLGTVLFQLPPNLANNEENLDRLLTSLRPEFNNVIEFRHESWWTNDIVRMLKNHQITFCSISYPGLPEQVIPSGRILYYRFHGIPQLYKSAYTDEELGRVVSTIRSKRYIDEVYLYFNNDIDVAAIDNARAVQQMVAARG